MVKASSGGEVEVNRSSIEAGTTRSILLADSTAKMYVLTAVGQAFGIDGSIYLSTGSYIGVGSVLTSLRGTLRVEMQTPTPGAIVAQRSSGIFTPADLAKFSYVGGTHGFARASGNTQIVLAN
jgi:hypothetical protein